MQASLFSVSVCISVWVCYHLCGPACVEREENVLSYWEGVGWKNVFSDVTHMLVELQLTSI